MLGLSRLTGGKPATGRVGQLAMAGLGVGLLACGSARPAFGETITLTGVVRDFSDSHPDFERYLGVDPGIAEPRLGPEGKPVFAGTAGNPTVTSRESFDQWYRDVPGVNVSRTLAIQLDNTLTPDPRVYTFDDQTFFPIDGELLGNEGRAHNFHFTYELHSRFTYQTGQFFRFSGDDDLWVYIDGRLVIDLGGVHSSLTGSVELDRLGLTPGETYDIDFFHAERHTGASHFRIDTSIVLVQPTATASATPTPSATPTEPPTATPTATATSTHTPSPTLQPAPRYLPLAVKLACGSRRRHADVVLVVDLSTSMRLETPDGSRKVDAALDAASDFVAQLRLRPDRWGDRDQAAIVGFNSSAWIGQPLTSDATALRAALAALASRVSKGTRLDLALLQAHQASTGANRNRENLPVILLLTDGMPTEVPPAADGRQATTVLHAASLARSSGATIYSVGFGSERDFNPTLLRRIASTPAHYRHAPDAAGLRSIYHEIAELVSGCPPGSVQWP